MKASINAGREGTMLVAGETLYDPSTRALYQCEDGGLYHHGDMVTISGLNGASDLPMGSMLVWRSPQPGCGLKVTIVDPEPSARPVTRAEFDTLVAKVDNLTARFDKLLKDNAVRLVTDDTPREVTYTVHLSPSPSFEALRETLAEMAKMARPKGDSPEA